LPYSRREATQITLYAEKQTKNRPIPTKKFSSTPLTLERFNPSPAMLMNHLTFPSARTRFSSIGGLSKDFTP
jgi:hypothetical protein